MEVNFGNANQANTTSPGVTFPPPRKNYTFGVMATNPICPHL